MHLNRAARPSLIEQLCGIESTHINRKANRMKFETKKYKLQLSRSMPQCTAGYIHMYVNKVITSSSKLLCKCEHVWIRISERLVWHATLGIQLNGCLWNDLWQNWSRQKQMRVSINSHLLCWTDGDRPVAHWKRVFDSVKRSWNNVICVEMLKMFRLVQLAPKYGLWIQKWCLRPWTKERNVIINSCDALRRGKKGREL